MGKRAKRFWSGLGVALCTAGVMALLRRGGRAREQDGTAGELHRNREADRWARPGMRVTFRAELMPGRDREQRTFRVVKLLPRNRVLLEGAAGEHTEHEFEPVR